MNTKQYDQFVSGSDWTKERPPEERIRIARYGLAAEIGSLATALKKKIIHHPPESWAIPNEQICEELGDCLWYVTQISLIENGVGLDPIIISDAKRVLEKIESNEKFRNAISEENREKFKFEVQDLISTNDHFSLDQYQEIAILTARTTGRELLDVSLAKLLIYASIVMAQQFSDTEALQGRIPEFIDTETLGAIFWHISAIAHVYNVKLSEIAESNQNKIRDISNLQDSPPTSLYDRVPGTPSKYQFPSQFKITYVSPKEGRLQMYYQGRALGDELDDNAKIDDGYRFHDTLHLANAAILGWSPVLRALMGLKRKHDPQKDNAEDGARARIVEEAIVKATHSESIRIARLEGLSLDQARRRLFSEAQQIPYDFLKLIMSFAKGLEVEQSRAWEWRKAISEGHRLYTQLSEEKQGTVYVDLDKRSVEFSPFVVADVHGPVVDSALAVSEVRYLFGRKIKPSDRQRTEVQAILKILGIRENNIASDDIKISHSLHDQISVKAKGVVQEKIWEKAIIGFRSNWTKVGGRYTCLVMAIGAPN